MKPARRRSQRVDRTSSAAAADERLPPLPKDVLEWLQHDPPEGRASRRRYDAVIEMLLSEIRQQKLSKPVIAYLRARTYIEENYLRLHTIGEVATPCQVSPMYLSRLFRRFARIGTYQFIISLKMKRAAELLCETDMTVRELADKMAFADPFHFSRVFKRVHGIAPEGFARQHRRSTAE